MADTDLVINFFGKIIICSITIYLYLCSYYFSSTKIAFNSVGLVEGWGSGVSRLVAGPYSVF